MKKKDPPEDKQPRSEKQKSYASKESQMPPIHYVNPAPFDPLLPEPPLTPEQEHRAKMGQGWLLWRRFCQNRLALWAGILLLLMYLTVPFAEFLAPYDANARHPAFLSAPPQGIHLIHAGRFVGPFVYDRTAHMDLERLQWVYTTNRQKIQPLRFFCQGASYRFWGIIPAEFHLVCPAEGGNFHLLGTDRLGRDMLSGLIYGARISLTIGLIGVLISLTLGLFLGGLAGFFGGWLDALIQRLIEILRSLPELPLWMALSAALPVTWNPVWIYFGMTLILGLLEWPGLAYAVRSKLLSLREEEYAKAAILMGASSGRVIYKHLLPGFSSHIIASATLSIPAMLLGETALSFLNLGLRRPAVSWGVLLNEAQNITVVTIYPWLMAPVIPIILVVLAFNFVGDGLRDAVDPHSA